MITEIVLLAGIIFLLLVFFYKQRRQEFELLQVEFSAAATSLPEMSGERQPIILRGVPVPPILTAERLGQIPRLDEFPLVAGSGTARLGPYRRAPGSVFPEWQLSGQPICSADAGEVLATELALPLWVDRTLRDVALDLGGWSFATSMVSRVALGGHGLQRVLPAVLCILPTEGTYVVSLVSASSEPFLPVGWATANPRYPRLYTVNDTPMVGEIKYLDIIVRPGTMLCLPAQTVFSMEPKEVGKFSAALMLEVHSPVSRLAKLLA
jgi:hypothetical protein